MESNKWHEVSVTGTRVEVSVSSDVRVAQKLQGGGSGAQTGGLYCFSL
jgi:hypothetical protein